MSREAEKINDTILTVTEKSDGAAEKGEIQPTVAVSHQNGWDGDNDLANPQNWSIRRKWTITMILSGFAVLPSLSSTIISPAQFIIGAELGISKGVVLEICLSIFNLGLGIGPLLMSPLSETFGRYPVILVGNVFFLAWNTGSGFVGSESQLIVCRLFTGLGASTSNSVLGAVLGDIWPPERRARAVGIATFLPLLGPALGPIVGGYITQDVSWRWILWVVSMADVILLTVGARFLKETYAPLILEKRSRLSGQQNSSSTDRQKFLLLKKIAASLARPFILLGTERMIQITCAFAGVVYGTLFLELYSYPLLWTNVYHQGPGPGSLNYISTGVGYILGAQALKKRNDGKGEPRYRLPLLVPSAFLIAGGLIVLGWTGQRHVYWLVPNIGNLLFQAGSVLASQVITVYTIDAFATHAASALSTNNFVRSVASFAFPLFAPALYDRLGWGWSSTLLGLVTAGLILLMGVWLWYVGSSSRKRDASGEEK